MRHRITTSQEAQDLHAALDRSPIAYAYFDMSDRLRFWNRAYEDLNFRIRHMICDGVPFSDLLAELVVMGQIDIPQGGQKDWIDHRLERRRQGGTDFRHLSDGRTFLVQERHDELGGTLGFWTDMTHLFLGGAFQKNQAAMAPIPPALCDHGCQNVMREHLQAVLAPLELLQATEYRPEILALVNEALTAVTRMTRVLDRERPDTSISAGVPQVAPGH